MQSGNSNLGASIAVLITIFFSPQNLRKYMHQCFSNDSFIKKVTATLVSDLWDVLFFFTDTVFFHLPPRCGDRTTVYGVSCYRQIEAKVTFQAMNNITEVIGLMH